MGDCVAAVPPRTNERGGAVAEEAAEFAFDAAGDESAAVEVGGDDCDGARLTGGDLRLSHGERVDDAKAGAADVERAAGFAGAERGVETRGQRRVEMIGLAGGDD